MTKQMPTNDVRPRHHLNTASKLYPKAWKLAEDYRSHRGQEGLPSWPEWCFLPMAAWYAIVSADSGYNVLPPQIVGDVSKLSAIGCWRYSQGIYRVDPDVLDALTHSVVKGSLPSEVLYRLPEWCIYVEMPGFEWLGETIEGFWAHLEWDANSQRSELRILLDGHNNLTPVVLHLGPWTVTEATDRAIKEAGTQARAAGINASPLNSSSLVEDLSQAINPLVSILLYLCSEEPEIEDDRVPGVSPSYPKTVKTKKGWRLFPPDKPRVWDVGKTLGAQLRQADEAERSDTGRRVRVHLRRGHWHGYWTGPQKGERKFIYRWLSPLVVKGRAGEEASK